MYYKGNIKIKKTNIWKNYDIIIFLKINSNELIFFFNIVFYNNI